MQTIGYARPSLHAADLAAQISALTNAGCSDVIVDHGRGRHPRDLKKRIVVLNRLQTNDTLVVYRLECIAVSGKDLLATLSLLIDRKIHLQVLHDNLHSARDGCKETFVAITAAFAILSTAISYDDGDVRLPGRSAILRSEDWEQIQADAKVMSAAAVARHHNVSRSTLYNYLRRMEKQSEHAV